MPARTSNKRRSKPRRRASDTPSDVTYAVWQGGEVRTTTARAILAGIQKDAHASGELRSISPVRYANALVEDATSADLLLRWEDFVIDYAKSAAYMAL